MLSYSLIGVIIEKCNDEVIKNANYFHKIVDISCIILCDFSFSDYFFESVLQMFAV